MNFRFVIVLIVFLTLHYSCKKQTDYVAKEVTAVFKKTDVYYENLRAYKKSDHQIFFGWWGGTGDEGSPDLTSVYDHIPDSVDIVSLWGGIPPLNSHAHNLLQKTRKLKGTKFVNVFFPNAFDRHNFSRDEEGVRKFAADIIETNNKYDLDGIDIDYESHVLSIFEDDNNFKILVEELGKHFGPKSGTGKLFIIDAFVERIPSFALEYIDYFALQHYSPQGGTVSSIKSRLDRQVAGFPYSKCIITENYEAVWSSGGLLLDFVKWNPIGDRKAGVGTYHAEYEYAHNPDYKYLRQAIQIMNPAVK